VPELRNLGGNDRHAIALVRIALEILLVVCFGGVKNAEGNDLCYDWFIPDLLCFQVVNDLPGSSFLLGTVIENRRAVLRPHVGTLPVERGGIVNGEKHF